MLELQVSTIVITVVNLLILYAVLKKILFGRVRRVLQERAELGKQNVSQAEREKARAEELKAEYEQKLAQARTQAADIVAQAKKQGSQEYQAIVDQAQNEARRLQAQAQAQNQADREAMLRSARREVAQLAVMAAAKVAQQELDARTDRAVAEQFLSEASEQK